MRIWGRKLMLVPPLTSWLMWSPYFFGAKRAAAHLRVSTRKRATLQFSCVAVSAISIHSLKNLSACASRARAYLSRKSSFHGPSLAGVFGRKSGSAPGYNYSPALKSVGITWDEQELDKYL